VYNLIFGKNSLKSTQDAIIIGFYIAILYMKGSLINEKIIEEVILLNIFLY